MRRVIYCCVLLCLVGLTTELGKSDKKKKVAVEDEVKNKPPMADPVVEEYSFNDDLMKVLKYPPQVVTKESILKEHEQIDRGDKRNFEGPALAFITPWNGHGYDMAKWTTQKLTHISPVWLQAKSEEGNANVACRIEGTHDIDRGWIEELREKNPNVKIVPRILFDSWTMDEIRKLLEDSAYALRCARDITEFLTRNQFDGAVIEAWMPILAVARSKEAMMLLHESLETLSLTMKKHNLQVIYPVGPPLRDVSQPSGLFEPHDFRKLASHADFVQIMTYDYMSQTPAGVGPIAWVGTSIEYLLSENKDIGHKLLIGLNYYGYEYSRTGVEPVKYDRFLELLKQDEYKLEWDGRAMEHRLIGKETLVYYPSISSVELRLLLATNHDIGFAIWEYGQGLNYFSKLL